MKTDVYQMVEPETLLVLLRCIHNRRYLI
jgi:hypothetical protein